jgi:RNA polymerase sigma factor (TIGR02999 family)
MKSEPPEGPDLHNEEVDRFVEAVAARATDGDPAQLDELLPTVYEELRGLADALLRRERREHTIRPTALVHEAYLRLARQDRVELQGREHLLALAATTMRRVLVDYARRRGALKRGQAGERVSLRESLFQASAPPIDLLDLDRALDKLAREDPRKVQAVELLYFAGLTFEDAAAALGVSSRTVVRDWRYAKAWLWRELSG